MGGWVGGCVGGWVGVCVCVCVCVRVRVCPCVFVFASNEGRCREADRAVSAFGSQKPARRQLRIPALRASNRSSGLRSSRAEASDPIQSLPI